MNEPRLGRFRSSLLVAAGAAVGALLASQAPTSAQNDRLPTSCSSGDVLVSEGFDRFRCMSRSELLGLSSCSSGELVTAGSGGRLHCGRPSFCSGRSAITVDDFGRVECFPVARGARLERGLLPECPSGSPLLSEGGGSWRCGPR